MATVCANENFDVLEAANELILCLRGRGKDEKRLIATTVGHDDEQRQEIKERFQLITGKYLESELKSEFRRNMEKCMLALYTPLHHFLATSILKSFKGDDTDDSILLEILGTLPNQEISKIQEAFSKEAGRSLEEALEKDGSDRTKSLLRQFLHGGTSFFLSGKVQEVKVPEDALVLFQAGESRFQGNNKFMEIFCANSYSHMKKVYEQYEVISGHVISDVINKETKGKERDAFLALVQLSSGIDDFLAERINCALKKVLPDADCIIRIFVARCQFDLCGIERAYARKYGKTLQKALGKLIGGFEDLLVALLGRSE